ncbi:MAG: hypothetical protein LBQ94_09210, partial [Treponema sp.]|nr:hypothetical protein [Treponema sp.]
IENPINPFTGNAVSIEPKNNALYIAISAPVHISDKSAFQYKFNPEIDYYVHDNIFDENNWIRADRYQHEND